MKSVLDIIKERRSIDPDKFNGKIIPENIIEQMMEAAHWAPTHKFTEPWDFILFKGEGCKQFGKIHAELYKKHEPEEYFLEKKYEKLLHRADLCSHVIICTMKRNLQHKLPEIEEICAASAAIENMLLVATANDVATFWSTGGLTHHDSLKKYFNYSAEDKILGVIYIGYAEDKCPEGKRLSLIAEKYRYYKV